MTQIQKQIPGTEDVKDELLSRLVGEYVQAAMAKAEATKKADERHESLVLQMQEKGVESYRDPDTGVEVSLAEKLKIKIEKPRQQGTRAGAAALANGGNGNGDVEHDA